MERKKVSILTSEDDYQQYLDNGLPLLQNIEGHWLAVDLAGKQHIVGSIFPGKLVFEQNAYRTVEENAVLKLIAIPGMGLNGPKNKKVSTIADLSYQVPGRRNLSNLFIEDLKATIRFLKP